ncbi:MAG: glycosyltransferase family 39 protein [Nitrososphaerota archaeon]|nr:glycosyltransferase family 39 protein [Nitrososphaerota archaeon]MDG7024709.1 glycosyltransferase family 39 protein [Nitrososphaerota archaeon]
MSGPAGVHRKDLLFVVLAAAAVKVASLVFIQSTVGGNLLDQLSTRWDSVYYVSIARIGYPAGSVSANYAFAPGYPTFIWLANFLVGNYLLSAAIVSNVFSVLAVVVFYHVAKIYFSPRGSLHASLALTLFPTFVTYGLVSYSEPVYLTFAMLAVYFFLKGRYFNAGMASSLAVLSGYASLLIPVLFSSILILRRASARFGQLRPGPGGQSTPGGDVKAPTRYGFVWLMTPLLVFGLWMCLLDVRSGVQYALFVAQKPWGTALANPVAQFSAFLTGIFSTQGNPVEQMLLRYPYTISFLALAYPLWKIDGGLAFYSFAFMLFVLSLVGTAYMSGPRLMLSAWPVLLVFGRAKKEYLPLVLTLLALISLQSTYAQLTSFWT